MTDGIDWKAIEQARAQLSARPEIPEGWINAQMYADRFSVSRDGAGKLLRAMSDRGLMERAQHGQGFIYRPASNVRA